MMTARSDPSRAQSACTAGASTEQLGDNGFKYAEIDALPSLPLLYLYNGQVGRSVGSEAGRHGAVACRTSSMT
jgi:hypothetical protein